MAETTYKIRRSKDGQFYWVQIAGNGEVLATSETYRHMSGAIDGARAAGATAVEVEPENDDG